MKAPEKFYYAPYGDVSENYPITDNDIEYIRKDAFIEKAKSWLENNLQGIVGGSIYIEDFRKYMEE